jgi:hypothetical protein
MENHKLSEREIGWLEGIIDGEGYLGILKSKAKKCKEGFYWNVKLSIANTNLEICKKTQNLFSKYDYVGGSITKQTPKIKNSKVIYIFNAKIGAIRNILPLLHLIVKERQRQILLEALDVKEKYRISEIYGKGGGRPSDIEKKMETLYQETKTLNKKGIK